PDTGRIWWSDAGVHQNLTFPVHPDPTSGMHSWHQPVRVRRAEPGDRPADIFVATDKSRARYRAWLARTPSPHQVSPDGTRRPYWLLRPLKPTREVYALPPVLPDRTPGPTEQAHDRGPDREADAAAGQHHADDSAGSVLPSSSAEHAPVRGP